MLISIVNLKLYIAWVAVGWRLGSGRLQYRRGSILVIIIRRRRRRERTCAYMFVNRKMYVLFIYPFFTITFIPRVGSF